MNTLPIGSQFTHIYKRLVIHLVLVGVFTLAALMTAMLVFDKRLVHTLSGELIQSGAEVAQQKLAGFFEPVAKNLFIAAGEIEEVDLGAGGIEDKVFRAMAPFLNEYDQVKAVTIADKQGRSLFLSEQPRDQAGERNEVWGGDRSDGRYGTFVLRRIDAGLVGEGTGRWMRWRDAKLEESWTRKSDFDARSRPWFQAAMAAPAGKLEWTAPYMFFTAKEPGVTVATKWIPRGSDAPLVIAFDMTLADISRFTEGLRPSPHGMVTVLTKLKRVIGLPPGYPEPGTGEGGLLLKTVQEFGNPILENAVTTWEGLDRSNGAFRFSADGEDWWGGIRTFALGGDPLALIAVFIPENDFIAPVIGSRNLTLSALALAGFVFGMLLILSALRRVRLQLLRTVSQVERNLGQYRLEYKIGDGGNGAVYRARHALLRRPTAIKLLHPEFARSPEAKARFEHEVQILSGLTHPNTVAVYDYGQTPEGTYYYAMEYLAGVTLEELVRTKGPQVPARVIYILQHVCGSLAEAHAKGLIHRDIKPANIMLCERGGMVDVVKVLDFGLVKEQGGSGEDGEVNVLEGTPLYMAPETITSANAASAQSDIYAIGAVGYYLLAGRNVFEGAGTVDICAQHLHDQPVPPSRYRATPIPGDLEQLLLQCLEKDPALRPPSALALADMLAACEDCGHWTSVEARSWWETHRDSLPLGEERETGTALTNTQILVDVDERLGDRLNGKELDGINRISQD